MFDKRIEKMLKSVGAKFLDVSYTSKKGVKHARYYIHIKPEIVEGKNPRFPFKPDDLLKVKIIDGKLTLSRLEVVVKDA